MLFFQNAALHWIKQSEKVIKTIEQALKPGGRFVAEFGGLGNVEKIIRGIEVVLQNDYGIDSARTRNPWYFPSIGEYSSLLEENTYE